MLIILVNGCKQKTINANPKCQAIERNLLDLKQEKSLILTAKVLSTMANGYPYGQSSYELDQRIKILSMELEACYRKH
jgi:hypothetical protein